VNTHSPKVLSEDNSSDFILSEQQKIERILERYDIFLEIVSQRSTIFSSLNDTNLDYACSAYTEYTNRREMDDIFEFKNFSQSPCWDIMLYLFMSRCINSSISISSVCNGVILPSTTGLRWLKVLEDRNLLARSDDPSNRRRAIVSITDKGWAKTCKALELRPRK
jgi:Winged helix DNA-binding domain